MGRFILIHEISMLGKNASPSALAKKSMLEPHTVSSLLTRMEKDGLVSKTLFEKPRNMVRVELTEKAKELRELAWQKTPILNEFWENCLSPDEVKILLELLVKLKKYNLPIVHDHKKSSHTFTPKYDPKTNKIIKYHIEK